MRKIFTVLCCILFISASNLHAQGSISPGKSFTIGNPGTEDGARVIRRTPDGYIAGGYTNVHGLEHYYLVKLDLQGRVQWQRMYRKPQGNTGQILDISLTKDSGYLALGFSQLTRFDKHGNILWSKIYRASNQGVFSWRMMPTSDGGCIMGGSALGDFVVTKVNALGEVQWAKSIGGSDDDQCFSICKLKDSSIILAGHTRSFNADGYDMYVVKLSKDGTVLWSKRIGGSGYDFGRALVATSDGNFVVAGYSSSFGGVGYALYAVKMSMNGALMWSKVIPISDEFVYDAIEARNGDIVFAGDSFKRLLFVRLSPSGKLVWSSVYSNNNFYATGAQSIIQINNLDDFIAAGVAFGDIHSDMLLTVVHGDGTFCHSAKSGFENTGAVITDVSSFAGQILIATSTDSLIAEVPQSQLIDFCSTFSQETPSELNKNSGKNELISAVSIKPNPVKNVLRLQFNSSENGVACINILSSDGRIENSQKINVTKGNNSKLIEVTKLSAGLHSLQLFISGRQMNLKFIRE